MNSDLNASNIPAPSANRVRSRWVVSALSDWLELLSGPPSSIFTEIVRNEDWKRLLKLLTLVLFLSGLILGLTVGISGSLTNFAETILVSKHAVVALLIGAFLAIIYNSVAALFGVKISILKSFFVTLSILLPWLPLFALLQMLKLPQIDFPLIGLVYIFGHFIFIKSVANFYLGVVETTNCVKWRVLASILVPLILVACLIIYMFS